MSQELTPLMKQYQELKTQVPDALLFFRMGDFYELFGEDAITASKILEITLTSRERGKKENALPMAGVPHHSAQSYIQKLLDHGKKVAIGEQMEDPDEARKLRGYKAIVRREIIRVLTPAIQFDTEGSQNHFLATASPVRSATPLRYTLSLLDISTGETKISLPLDESSLLNELMSLPIKHFLRVGHDLFANASQYLQTQPQILFEELPSYFINPSQAVQLLQSHYGIASLEPFLESGSDLESSTLALGCLFQYLEKTQKIKKFSHIKPPQALHHQRTMKLGPKTEEHLDLAGLYERIQHTQSAMGSRLLRQWVLAPLRTPKEILDRQACVLELSKDVKTNGLIKSLLKEVYDIDRISARINTGLASPRDTYALGKTLHLIQSLTTLLNRFQSEGLIQLKELLRALDEKTRTLSDEILNTQNPEPPFLSREGKIFQKGTHPELDRLIELNENGQEWLIRLEQKEREQTGIPSLKVKYNRVFGYFIEVTTTHLKNVPSHYQRKQTTVGGERFFTEELKNFENEIISADGKQKALEQELFKTLVSKIQENIPLLSQVGEALAQLDALRSLSQLAWETNWCFPTIDFSTDTRIIEGRHPLVDQGRGLFIPNNLVLDPKKTTTLLITGPNMGGKSTFMRQMALIVLLGQMGAPVPAREAHWGVFSSLYTRIGAQDAIARGQSTFMVEMSELAHILHFADERSLIILDEIGRGTSTYDGISVAWASLEWITTRLKARTLFATHYHELTELPSLLPQVANAHFGVDDSKKGLRFLYLLKEGPANESFGIQVAKLAGLPQPVIQQSWKILTQLEASHLQSSTKKQHRNTKNKSQLSLFDVIGQMKESPQVDSTALQTGASAIDPEKEKILEEIRIMDLNSMTPFQTMQQLQLIQNRLKKEETPDSFLSDPAPELPEHLTEPRDRVGSPT